MKQTRQAVRAIKQSIFLDVYGWHSGRTIDSLSEVRGFESSLRLHRKEQAGKVLKQSILLGHKLFTIVCNKLECLSLAFLFSLARQEPTGVERLSGAPQLGRLLDLPTNIRLTWISMFGKK